MILFDCKFPVFVVAFVLDFVMSSLTTYSSPSIVIASGDYNYC